MGTFFFNPYHNQETLSQYKSSLKSSENHTELMTHLINNDKVKANELKLIKDNISSLTISNQSNFSDLISTNKIINETLGIGFDSIGHSLDSLVEILDVFHTDFNIALSIANEQIRVSNLLLANIIEVLKIPDSEKERLSYFQNGLKHLKNGNIDIALKSFLYVEKIRKNKIDYEDNHFLLYQIGKIYLTSFNNFDINKAYNYLSQACDLISVESNSEIEKLASSLGYDIYNYDSEILTDYLYNCSLSALLLGKFDKVIFYCNLGLQKNPESCKLLFLISKTSLIINNEEKAFSYIEKLININPQYCIKISTDGDFKSNSNLHSLLTNLEKQFYENKKEQIISFVENVDDYKKKIYATNYINEKFLDIDKNIDNIYSILNQRKILSSYKADFMLNKVKDNFRKVKQWTESLNIQTFFDKMNNYINFSDYQFDEINNQIIFPKQAEIAAIKITLKSDYEFAVNSFNNLIDNRNEMIHNEINNIRYDYGKRINDLKKKEEHFEKSIRNNEVNIEWKFHCCLTIFPILSVIFGIIFSIAYHINFFLLLFGIYALLYLLVYGINDIIKSNAKQDLESVKQEKNKLLTMESDKIDELRRHLRPMSHKFLLD
jgi:tetratricopeptide (TPR) repeat protein